jgi:hypothetical protein
MENEKVSPKDIRLILRLALLNLLLYLITTAFTSYGIFRDEYYYIACANRLDFGYVDHPPLSIWILALWKSLFGDSMFIIRLVPAIVTSVVVFMIGLFTVRLGGKSTAIILSTISFMLTPIFLGMNTIYSMNVFDFMFWISSSYIFLRIIQTGNKKLWFLLGVVIGFGLLNKTSMLWLSAGVFIGVVLTPLRKDLKTKYPYFAAATALLIFSPYIIWNITHDFAHLEFMQNAASRKYGGLTPISFIIDQILILNPLAILIWFPGLMFYFFNKEGKQFRAIGIIWLTTFFILLVNRHSKGEYLAAAYPILFTGGAVLIERWGENKKTLKFAIALPIILVSILLTPFARPLLSVDKFLEFQKTIGLKPPSNEGHETILPQFYSDMFGWEELAQNVSNLYLSLAEEERKTTYVFCSNYGKAGAIEYYSKNFSLPKVICPHNSYWYWTREIKDAYTVIIIGGEIENHKEGLEEVFEASHHRTKYAMPYENNLKIFIGRGLKIPLKEIMNEDKAFI